MRAEIAAKGRSKEQGAALVIALLVVLLLFMLGVAILTVSDIENSVSANDIWEEGAFNAAEAGVQRSIDQLGADPTASVTAIPVTTIGDRYSYRSGRIVDGSPQPLQFLGTLETTGFTLGSGTGYNESGFVYNLYQVNATGSGPRNSQREIEVQVTYGPVPG